MANNTHGGKRKGSGRKPSGKKQITLRLKPETIMRIRETAKSHGITAGAAVDAAVAKLPDWFVTPPQF